MKESRILAEPFLAGSGNMNGISDSVVRFRFAAIIVCRRGKARLRINLKTYEIVRNSQIVILPNSLLKAEWHTDDMLLDYLCFSEEMLNDICLRFEPYFFHFMSENPVHTYRRGVRNKHLISLFYSIRAIYNDRSNRFRTLMAKNVIQNFMYDIFDKTRRFFNDTDLPDNTRQSEIFNTFLSLVHKNCRKEREVTYYADRLCISPKYLTDICNSVSRMSAKKIIDDFIVQEIKLLLQSTNMTINEIASVMSFPDQSYLGRFFKKHTEMSPIKYRKIYSEAESISDIYNR